MSKKNNNLPTPEKGQQSNQNWDDQNDNRANAAEKDAKKNVGKEQKTSAEKRRKKIANVGTLDTSQDPLPVAPRIPGSNLTGPGLG